MPPWERYAQPEQAERASPWRRYAAQEQPVAVAAEQQGVPRSPGYQRAMERETRNRGGRQEAPRTGIGRTVRGIHDSLNFVPQITRNMGVADELAAGGAWAGQGVENLVRRAQGQPLEITQSEAASAAADFETGTQQQFAQEHPGQNALATALSIPAFAGNPVANAPRLGMLQAGGIAAATNAPFALARQEGDLQERLPGAALETAAVGGFGAGLQGLANRFLRPAPSMASPQARPTSRGRAQDFADAGVRPTLAATMQGGPALATKTISENILAGPAVRRRLQDSLDDTAGAARRLSEQAGNAASREVAGEGVQQGVRRFARDRNVPNPTPTRPSRATGRPEATDPRAVPVRGWSFPAKARALYDDVFARLSADEQAMVGSVEGPILLTDATRRTLGEIENRVQGPALRAFMENPQTGNIARALKSDEAIGELRFNDLRQLRSWVRRAQRDEGLRQGLDNADLQQIERALTEDIYASALSIGGQAAQDLRRIDQWYRAGNQRIERALEPFNQGGGAQAYRRIVDLASQSGRQNTRQLQSLRNSVRDDEWRTVSASVIDELGRPTPGAPNVMEAGAFSVNRFVTNYARMTPEGRRILFGDELARQLDTLARVAGAQKGVEAMANSSRSGSVVQNVGMGTMAATGNIPAAVALLAGMAAAGEVLTNPAFVRWLTSASKAGASVGGMRRHLAGLATLAARDPALAPYYDALAQRLGEQLQPEGSSTPARSTPPPRRTEPQLQR